MQGNRILFLCTGNYYRSRYAEELFNYHARSVGLQWTAFSRGLAEATSPDNVGAMSTFALEALKSRNIEPQGAARFPVSCSSSDFANARVVIALKESEHRPMLERRFPEHAHGVTYWDVDDIDLARPEDALTRIDRLVEELTKNMLLWARP